MSDPHIVVTGLMGVGKSTLGRALADALGWPYSDSDDDIERLLGRSGRAFAGSEGVEALHELEAAVLIGALARPEPHVVSAAASVVENDLAVHVLSRNAYVIRLYLSIEETLDRQAAGSHRRQMDEAELVALAERREPMFMAIENHRVDAADTPASLVQQILDVRG